MTLEEQRRYLISDWINGSFSITELAARYHVSRKTVYKWMDRFYQSGDSALSDIPRVPETCPHKTPAEVEKAILECRTRHATWGAKKILAHLLKSWSPDALPCRATVCSILLRNGYAQSPKKRRNPGHPGPPTTPIEAPNATWCADFKGEFKLKTGDYCYPLTITDGFTRYLLTCKALRNTRYPGTFRGFEEAFLEYGLPDRIRTDNGVPFGTIALARLSALSVWFIRLGIYPEYIEPGCPQQNGRHERMHRTLKAEATKPPESSMPRQQRRFDAFQKEYNEERPHEAIGMATPGSLYQASTKPFPKRLPEITYPPHFIERYVSHNGGIRYHSKRILVTQVLSGQQIGMEELDHGVFNVYFGPVLLGKWLYDKPYVEGLYNYRRRVKV
jgi:putative transposase